MGRAVRTQRIDLRGAGTLLAIVLTISGGRRGPAAAMADEPVPTRAAGGPSRPAAGRGTLTGVVQTPDGCPATGARVVVYRHEARFDLLFFASWRRTSGMTEQEREEEESAQRLRLVERSLHPLSLTPTATGWTTRDGCYRLTGLPAGLYDVVARPARGAGVGMVWPVEVRTGTVTYAPISLWTEELTTVTGRVTRADGQPFDGHVFAVMNTMEDFFLTRHGGTATRVGANGEYRLDALPFRPEFLYATDPGRSAAWVELDLWGESPYPSRLRIDFAVGARATPLEVLVLDAESGHPIHGATVVSWHLAESTSPPDGTAAGTVMNLVESVTGTDGRARHLGYPRVRATAHGYVTASGKADDSSRCVLRLRRGATLRGVVRAPDGTGAAGVPVYVEGADRWRARPAYSGPSGEFEIAGLPRERVEVLAVGDGWVPSNALAEARAREGRWSSEVDLTSGTAVVHLPVRRGSRMRVRVESVNGSPIRRVPVRMFPLDEKGGGGSAGLPVGLLGELPSFTDETGVATFDGLAPGFTYGVDVVAPGHRWRLDSRVLVRDAPGEWTEVLEPTRTVKVRVRERGTLVPITGARLQVHVPKRTHPLDETTRDDGIAEIRDLPLEACTFTLEGRIRSEDVVYTIPNLGPCPQDILLDAWVDPLPVPPAARPR